MDGYKIGKIARFLSLSSEALRYYEKNGIVHSRRDPESGYRYYDAWDVNYLLDCTYLRSFDLPLNTVKSLMGESGLTELEQTLQQQALTLLEQRNLAQRKLDEACRYLERLRAIPDTLGRFVPADSPPLVFQSIRRDETLMLDKGRLDSYAFWNERKPFLKNTFLLPRRDPRAEYGAYFWGYSLPGEALSEDNRPHLAYAEYIPSYKAVYTVFRAYGENTFLDCFQKQVVEPMREAHYRLLPDRVVGNLLARVHEDGVFTRYCEVWMPVE